MASSPLPPEDGTHRTLTTNRSTSQELREFALSALRIVFPGHKLRAVGILFLPGVAIVARPFWEPLVETFLLRQFGIAVPNVPTATGWALIAIGVGLFLANLYAETRRPVLSTSSSVDEILRLVAESDAQNDWIHTHRGLRSSAVYRLDSNLRFEVSIDDADLQQQDFREPWANRHPDPKAAGYYYDLCYGSSHVKRFVLVGVDGERALLPLPNRSTLEVDRLAYKVAQIHDTTGTLEDYMRRSGLSLRSI